MKSIRYIWKKFPAPLQGVGGVFLLLLSFPVFAQNTKIVAHRGYWKTEGSAQNSLMSLEKAAAIGAYGSEFDVHLTANNVLVVFHDDTINGIATQAVPYRQIQQMTLSNGEVLPTLERFLKKAQELPDIRLVFELKSHRTPERNREAARLSVAMVEQMGLQDRTDYITFNMDAGLEFVTLTSGVEVAYLNGDVPPAKLKELGFTGLDYHYNVMKKHPEWYKEAHDLGLSVNVWTVNNPDMIGEIARMGADYITTDIPEEGLSIVKGE